MKTRRHAPDKMAFWSEHIKQWKSSGLLQREYCAMHGLGLKSFGRWKQILAKINRASGRILTRQPENLVPLSIIPDQEPAIGDAPGEVQSNAGIRLHVNGKYAIDLAVGFHAATLQTLLSTLDRT